MAAGVVQSSFLDVSDITCSFSLALAGAVITTMPVIVTTEAA